MMRTRCEDFEQVAALLVGDVRQVPQVVDEQDVDARGLVEEADVGPFGRASVRS
jgi:hypothetical protein